MAASLHWAPIAAMLVAGPVAAQYQSPPAAEQPYRIECAAEQSAAPPAPCRTDIATFIGRRVFDAYCASCHATDALGSAFAPALPDRVRHMSRAAFRNVLQSGYRGEASEMPRWADIPEVARYADALWTYLSARANGDLPPGPIDLLPGAGSP